MRAMIVTGPLPEHWQEQDIEPGLAPLQALVGGLIEALPYPIDSGIASVICNEEGKINGLPYFAKWVDENGGIMDYLAGPLVILGGVNDEGEMQPLTDEALAHVRAQVVPLFGPKL